MSDDFTFDDDTKGVLDKTPKTTPATKAAKSQSKKGRGGRPTANVEEKKTERVQCYLTKTEYAKLEEMLDGRPASVYFRNLLLKDLGV